MEPSPPPKKQAERKANGFHVTLRQRKNGSVIAQLKYGRYLICESDPSQVVSLYDLARDWNTKGVKLTTKQELVQRQAEALKYVPMKDQDLPI